MHEISKLLDTGLDRETLAILVALIENGVNPEALAAVVKELRRETAALKVRVSYGAPDVACFMSYESNSKTYGAVGTQASQS